MRASGSTYENKAATLTRRTRSFCHLGLTFRQQTISNRNFAIEIISVAAETVEMSNYARAHLAQVLSCQLSFRFADGLESLALVFVYFWIARFGVIALLRSPVQFNLAITI